ncbi:MAG: maleylpyruvate isomerase family mycothiol-dependent enzyme, partial [Actinomycetota bacterium]|nr:maleylpyruvate isomerase family mycothiol-dependent enzyme [Actinomycetota bacterium]
PACPGWSVADMVVHLGGVHRWATHLVANRASEYVSRKTMGLEPPPTDPAELPQWFADGAAALLAALRGTAGDQTIWSWTPDTTARFWSRRQLQETTMHRVDAELAAGLPARIDSEVAADGVDELVALWVGIHDLGDRLAEGGHLGDTVHLHATDREDDGEWTFSVTGDGLTWAHDHGKGACAVRASASDLLMLLSNRIDPDAPRVELFGDADVLDHLRHTVAI